MVRFFKKANLRQFKLLAIELQHFLGLSFNRTVDIAELRLKGEYIVSTEKGLYLFKDKKIKSIYPIWSMGIAVQGDDIYIASSNEKRSKIVKTSLSRLLGKSWRTKSRILYEIDMVSSSERIHQVCVDNNYLVVANTSRNTLLTIDKSSGEVVQEIAPFVDRFNVPILYDHNHINSVSVIDCGILFVAYKAGSGSLICLMNKDKKVYGFPFKNSGVHDIFVKGDAILFSDTFGPKENNNVLGSLMKNSSPVDFEFFSRPPGYAVRGIAGCKGELLVGNSFKGARAKRFKGKASVIVLHDDKVVNEVKMPFSQFYDIVRMDGSKFDNPILLTSEKDILSSFNRIFGPPSYVETAVRL